MRGDAIAYAAGLRWLSAGLMERRVRVRQTGATLTVPSASRHEEGPNQQDILHGGIGARDDQVPHSRHCLDPRHVPAVPRGRRVSRRREGLALFAAVCETGSLALGKHRLIYVCD